jgi:outer membrane protein OmpA-like peptidoglycan-associated protein
MKTMHKNRLILLLLFLAAALCTQAQEVQWAEKVVAVSSEYKQPNDEYQFRASQVLGKPNSAPFGVFAPTAWSSVRLNNSIEEFIHVSFAKAIAVKQVAVVESFNAGAITAVYAYDERNNPNLIYKNPVPATRKPGVFSIQLPEKTDYKVKAIKVVLNPSAVKGYNQIDAIGISDSDAPIEASIVLGKNVQIEAKPERLSNAVNSPHQEIAPVISPDGKTLYFTRDRHPQNIPDTQKGQKLYKQDVWYSQVDANGEFMEAVNIGPPINNAGHNSVLSISADGNTLLLNNYYAPNGELLGALSISKRQGDKWGQPDSISIEGYKNLSPYSEFCFAPDGKALIIAIHQEKDTYGGKDLYVSFPRGNNRWSKPMNLGRVVNTASDEVSPFLAADGKSLYYASAGFNGYGKHDVYVTRRLDNTWLNWTEPQNLGPEINSPNWEAYFSIAADGKYAYYASNMDIYRIKLADPNKPDPVALLKGTVIDQKSQKPIKANVVIVEAGAKDSRNTESNEESGEYKNILPLGKKYDIFVEAKGYFPAQGDFDVSSRKEYTEVVRDFQLIPFERGQTVRLDHIYFGRGSADLLIESFPELDKLAGMMKENPTVSILLEGHTEIYGNKKSLVKLSESRVAAVKRYLVSKGIDAKRVKYKGYGPNKPLTMQDTEEARQLNRRVEVKVL